MDEISLKILTILQAKARIPNVEVARQVGLAPSAVLERIRKLEKQGIIDGYEVRLNPDHFGCSLIAFIFVFLNEGEPDRSFNAQLTAIPEIQEIHQIGGEEDGYLVKLRVADVKQLGQIRKHIAALGPVRSTRTQIVYDTVKETSHIPLHMS